MLQANPHERPMKSSVELQVKCVTTIDAIIYKILSSDDVSQCHSTGFSQKVTTLSVFDENSGLF